MDSKDLRQTVIEAGEKELVRVGEFSGEELIGQDYLASARAALAHVKQQIEEIDPVWSMWSAGRFQADALATIEAALTALGDE